VAKVAIARRGGYVFGVGRIALVWVASLVFLAPAAQAAPRSDGSVPAPAQIARLVSNVPVSTLNRVGAGAAYNPISSQFFGVAKRRGHLTSDGKPEIVTMNFAWCPHCATNSWALAVALSRFGTLTGLREIDTGTYYCKVAQDPCSLGPTVCFPHTHGLSFFNTVYRSPYISFAAIVLQDVDGRNLEKPTRREYRSINTFDPHARSAPALDIAGAIGFQGPGYDPGTLAHKTWSQIAGSLANPHNRIARHVDGLANLFTAAICRVTKGRPGSVCESRGVRAAAAAVLRRLPSRPPPPRPPS
jgi:hypothetical protein